jgi:SUMO ligase MMS21 Smc5/6 complex component
MELQEALMQIDKLSKLDASDRTQSHTPKESVKHKQTALKLGLPSLDFTALKQVKEYKDWYAYSQKLEHAI